MGSSVKYCGFEIERAPNNDGYILHQRKYEQEMLQRWGVESSVDHPNFKLREGDDDPEEPLDQATIKTAQAVAGALLCLNTRTKPDISVGVSAVCRLSTKNPVKSIEIGMNLMAYIHGNPGGLWYPGDVPTEIWGERGQLKIARTTELLEVFADTAYGTGSKGRSIQGMAIFFAGCVICWQTAVQPFVTHSTAESELVAYCDALNAGRSTEAMLTSMMGIPSGSNEIERILYGDNVAAIGLAHGTSSSSWRTRHLKIRSAYLREALEGQAPGGMWRLLHLSGKELVADGLTKPLLGQSFKDLGMGQNPGREHDPDEAVDRRGAAVMALMAGSLLLSGADAVYKDEGDTDSQVIWTCGAILMTSGAIYTGQLMVSGTKCCLKRLWKSSSQDEDRHRDPNMDKESVDGASVKIQCSDGTKSRRSSTSVSIKLQSGLQHRGESTSPLTR